MVLISFNNKIRIGCFIVLKSCILISLLGKFYTSLIHIDICIYIYIYIYIHIDICVYIYACSFPSKIIEKYRKRGKFWPYSTK